MKGPVMKVTHALPGARTGRTARGAVPSPAAPPRPPKSRALTLLAVLLPLLAGSAFAAQPPTIGAETSLPPLPPSAQWQSIINLRPGSNETVTLNPPIFSWFASPGLPPYAAYDSNIYRYIFQADYTGAFTNPVVNVATYSCCYNFIGPFTQSPVFWRVAYMVNNSMTLCSTNWTIAGWQIATNRTTTGSTTNCWITNQFNVASNATRWDRSTLADPSYLAKKVHPYMLFNGANGSSISNFIYTNDLSDFQINVQLAQSTTNASWYQNPAPWTVGVDYVTQAENIATVAFMWQLSGNSGWTNLLCTNYDNLVNYFNQQQLYNQDLPDPNLPISMSLTYDWLYPILSPAERSNAVAGLNNEIATLLSGTFWFSGQTYWMESKMGASHGWVDLHMAPFYQSLACFNDSPPATLFLNLDLNYLIARQTPFGAGAVNQGRSYAYEATFNAGTVDNNLMAGAVFPEARLNSNPTLNELADWWTRMVPPGYNAIHEQFGDVDLGVKAALWRNNARDFALLTQNGNVAMNGQQMMVYYGSPSAVYRNELVYPYFYPPPAPTVNNVLGVAYPDEGWAFGSTYPPNTTNCFYKGVGFDFVARPRGSEAGHSHFNDLDFEIWAYGANVTDGAGGSFGGNRNSWTANTVQINGLGQCETEAQRMTPLVAQIVAFTNAPNFVYVAGDATLAYPHQPFLADTWAGYQPAGWLMDGGYGGPESAGQLSCVSAVHRELLFEHHQYFVIYNTVQTTNAPTNTFSWVYHVFQNTVSNLNGGSFQYTSPIWAFNSGTSQFGCSSNNSVTTCVFQVVNAAELSVTNMLGSNAYMNPFNPSDNLFAGAMMDLTDGTANPISTNAIWVSNLTPTNSFHFMTVIYPVPPGGAMPTFTALDDYTVAVTSGAQADVISFNPETTNIGAVTLLVNSPAIWSHAPPLPALLVLTNYVGGAYTPPRAAAQPSIPIVANLHVVPPPAVNLGLNSVTSLSVSPVPGYFAWWNPETLSGTDFAPVPSWVDVSAKRFALGQCVMNGVSLTAPALRVAFQNGHNVLNYDGYANAMINSNYNAIASHQPIEVFAVVQNDGLGTSGFNSCFDNGNANGFSPNLLWAGTGSSGPFIYGGSLLQNPSGQPGSNWMVMTMLWNGSSSQIWTNGVSVASGNAGNAYLQGIVLGAEIGTYNTPQRFWNGSIGDVIIYTNVLSTASQQAIENGLRAKYGF